MRPYLSTLPTPHKDKINSLLAEHDKRLQLNKKGFLRYRLPFESVQHIRANFLDFSDDVVRIGQEDELSLEERDQVYQVMRDFMPWRKGPFNIFGIDIDAEWRSEKKWARLQPSLPELAGKVIADIGCNNGYYMFRMAHHKPRLVIGFEPYLQHHYSFKTLNSFAGQQNLQSELLGVEDIGLFEGSFDLVFLMGIIYHRISPIELLNEVNKSMKPGGTLIVESQAIPGDEPVALFPEKTYAKAPGIYFVPTGACLQNWMTRAGFTDVKILCSHPMNNDEQRRTDWMTFESFDDYMNPENQALTIEGYPAPTRVLLKGTSKD